MKKKLLLTGFDPFGGETVNPAFEAIRLLPEELAGFEIWKLEIPTEFIRSSEVLTQAVRAQKPDVVICVGQAGGRAAVTPERVAINLMDARIPDNAGLCPVEQPIVPDGPAAYFSTLPLRKMVEKLRQVGLPAEISNTAGTYVCNRLFYSLMHLAAQEDLPLCGGFVHVPYAVQQLAGKSAGTPAMQLEDIAQALRCCIEALTL